MKVLVPTAITDAILYSSDLPEPAATGETVWVSGAAYSLGDRRYRSQTHSIYECVRDHTGHTTPPEEDGLYWLEYRPTNRWSMFRGPLSHSSKGVTTFTVKLRPKWFNALALLGVKAEHIHVVVHDAPGGDIVYEFSGSLLEPVGSWWEYFFTEPRARDTFVATNIPPFSTAEVTVTLSSPTDVPVSLGRLMVGDMRTIAERYGVEAGAQATPQDPSYVDTNIDNTARFVKRPATVDMQLPILLDRSEASYALATCKELLSVEALWVANRSPAFDGLTVYGYLKDAPFTYDGNFVRLNLTVKGLP